MNAPNQTPVTDDGATIGVVQRTTRGTYIGALLTSDGQGYLPVCPGNQEEFSQPAHAQEAVLSEYRKRLSEYRKRLSEYR